MPWAYCDVRCSACKCLLHTSMFRKSLTKSLSPLFRLPLSYRHFYMRYTHEQPPAKEPKHFPF